MELCLELLMDCFVYLLLLAVWGAQVGRRRCPLAFQGLRQPQIMPTLCPPVMHDQRWPARKGRPKTGWSAGQQNKADEFAGLGKGCRAHIISGQVETLVLFHQPFHDPKPRKQPLEIAELSKVSCIRTKRKMGHFTFFSTVLSLGCIPETNALLHVNFT